MSYFGKYLDNDATYQNGIAQIDSYSSEESNDVEKTLDLQK